MAQKHNLIIRYAFLLFAISVIYFPINITAQQCLAYDPVLASATNDLCGPFVSDTIWVPTNLGPIQQSVISQRLNETYISSFRPLRPVIPLSCLNSILSLACNSAFQPCQNIFVNDLNRTAAIAFPPCRSVCEAVNQLCASFFTNYNHTPIDCTLPSQFNPNSPQYPESTVQTNVNGVLVNTSCYEKDMFPNPGVVWNVTACPYPLVIGPVPTCNQPYATCTPTAMCARPCPIPMWSQAQWAQIAHVIFAFATISFVLMFLLSVHYVVDPSCRKTTMRFQLYSFLCIMIFSLGWMMGGPSPQASMWCHDGVASDFNNHRCGAQAVFILYGGLSQSLWWAISAGCLFFRLDTGVLVISKTREFIFHVIAFGIPIVFTIVAARLNTLMYSPAAPICFVVGTVPNSNFNYHYALFYIPMCVAMLVALVFMIMSSFKLLAHTKMMRKTFKEYQVNAQLSLTQVNIRLFIWCFVLFLILFAFVIYRAVTQSQQDHIQNGLMSWAVCKIKYSLGVDTNASCPTELYPHPISYSGSVVHYVIVPSAGLFTFLAMGLSMHIVRFWTLLVRLLLERKYTDVIELLTNERALSKMSSGSSHSHEDKPTGLKKGSSSASLTSAIQIPPPNNTYNNSSEISDVELSVTSNPSPGTSS